MILITGITGKSGKWFLKELSAAHDSLANQEYRVTLRPSSEASIFEGCRLKIEKTIGDLDDLDFVAGAMQDVDTVVHIAGISKSLDVVRAAAQKGVKWLILVHTTGIYSKYKAAGEGYREIEREVAEIAATSHISLTILRPTMIYGSLKDKNIAVFIKMVDKLSLFPVVDHARYLLQPVHEKDLGKAYYQVLKNKSVTMGKSYTLSGKSPILLIDILRTIEKILNKKNLYLSIPFSVAYGGAVMLHILTLGKIDYREKVQRLVEPRAYPHDEAQRDFGYSPLTFEEGVLNEIKEYLEKTKPAKLAR